MISTALRGQSMVSASSLITASLAAASTGGAVTETRSSPPCSRPMAVFEARGWTLTASVMPSARVPMKAGSGGPFAIGRSSLVGIAWFRWLGPFTRTGIPLVTTTITGAHVVRAPLSFEAAAELAKCLDRDVGRVTIGPSQARREILTCLLAGGHRLLRGVPALAKTLLIKTLADSVNLKFSRIQIMPLQGGGTGRRDFETPLLNVEFRGLITPSPNGVLSAATRRHATERGEAAAGGWC